MTPLIDFTPESLKAVARSRRRARAWAALYVGTLLVLGAVYLGVTAGRSHREAERAEVSRLLRLEWARNEEAQKLLTEIRAIEEAINRYDRLASPVRASDVVGTIGALLPEHLSLTAMTLTPRTEKVMIPAAGTPGAPGGTPGGTPKRPVTRTISYLAVEIEGISPGDIELAELVSQLERCPLFSSVTMDFAKSAVVDGVQARAFRVSARVDFDNRFTFRDAPPSGGAVVEEPTEAKGGRP